MDQNVARASAVTVLAAGVGIGGLALVHNAQQLDRQGKIVIAAGNAQYLELAKLYQKDLAQYGVQVEIQQTTYLKRPNDPRPVLRPLEGGVTLRALVDDNS